MEYEKIDNYLTQIGKEYNKRTKKFDYVEYIVFFSNELIKSTKKFSQESERNKIVLGLVKDILYENKLIIRYYKLKEPVAIIRSIRFIIEAYAWIYFLVDSRSEIETYKTKKLNRQMSVSKILISNNYGEEWDYCANFNKKLIKIYSKISEEYMHMNHKKTDYLELKLLHQQLIKLLDVLLQINFTIKCILREHNKKKYDLGKKIWIDRIDLDVFSRQRNVISEDFGLVLDEFK